MDRIWCLFVGRVDRDVANARCGHPQEPPHVRQAAASQVDRRSHLRPDRGRPVVRQRELARAGDKGKPPTIRGFLERSDDRRRSVGRRLETRPRAAAITGNRKKVGDHGRARRRATGPGSAERNAAEPFGPDLDPVRDAADPRNRVCQRDGRRLYRQGHTPIGEAARIGDQLDREAARGRSGQLLPGHPADARTPDPMRRPTRAHDVAWIGPQAERQAREDHELVDRVPALA